MRKVLLFLVLITIFSFGFANLKKVEAAESHDNIVGIIVCDDSIDFTLLSIKVYSYDNESIINNLIYLENAFIDDNGIVYVSS